MWFLDEREMVGVFNKNVSDLVLLTEENWFTEFQKALCKHKS